MSIVNLMLSPVGTEERKAEQMILVELAGAAWNEAKTMKEANTCMELFNDIEAIKEDATTFPISSDDVGRLVKAFESVAGKRPNGWLKLGSYLLKQFVL